MHSAQVVEMSASVPLMSADEIQDKMSRAEHERNNSVVSTSLYIGKAIIGAGMLSLPVALDASGWYLGIILLVMFACLSQMTCHYLAVVINNFREFTIPRNPFMKFRDEHDGENIANNVTIQSIDNGITLQSIHQGSVDNAASLVSAQGGSLQPISAESKKMQNSQNILREKSEEWRTTRSQNILDAEGKKVQNSQNILRENSEEWRTTRSQNIDTQSQDTDEVADEQHEREKWQVDPKNLSEILLPNNFAWLLDLVIFLQTWPSAIPYYQIVGDAASKVLVYNLNVPIDDKSTWRAVIICVFAVVWFPFLVMISIVEVGKYTNLIGIFGLIYCAILAIAMTNFKWDTFPEIQDVKLPSGEHIEKTVDMAVIHNDVPQSAVDFLAKVPTFAFAYGCQFALFMAYNEMGKNASVKNATYSSGIGNFIASAFYMASMVCMYGTFGSNINGSFMDQLHDTYKTNGWVVTGQIFLFLAVSTGLPIYLHAGRNAFLSLIQVRAATFEPASKIVVGWGKVKMPAWLWRASVSLFLTAFAVILAIVITDLSSVLGILGIIASTPVVFIVPSYFYLRCYYKKWASETEDRMWERYGVKGTKRPENLNALWNEPKWKVYAAWVIFVMGWVIVASCLVGTVLYLAKIECVICKN